MHRHITPFSAGWSFCGAQGYLTYGTDAANMLFHVVNERQRRRRSVIFTTNEALKAWGGVLPPSSALRHRVSFAMYGLNLTNEVSGCDQGDPQCMIQGEFYKRSVAVGFAAPAAADRSGPAAGRTRDHIRDDATVA